MVITDVYDLAQSPGEVTLSLITPCAVDLSEPGEIVLSEAEFNGDYRTDRARSTTTPASSQPHPRSSPSPTNAWAASGANRWCGSC